MFDYIGFLGDVRSALLKDIEYQDIRSINGDDWEELVFEKFLEINQRKQLGRALVRTGAADFPDIVIDGTFGIEVKVANKDDWQTIGNSINESRRVENLDEIYFFFGRFGHSREIAFRPYEQCLKSIKTTHYPRYFVDMSLPVGESIFDAMGISYEDFRSLSSQKRISLLREFIRSGLAEGEELWWLEGDTQPVIRNYTRLTPTEQQEYMAKCFACFPELLGGNSRNKYERAAYLLLNDYHAVSSNLRDHFSAGGKVVIDLTSGESIKVPQTVGKFYELAKHIKKALSESSSAECSTDTANCNSADRYFEDYLSVIDRQSIHLPSGLKLSDVFIDGLRKL